MAREKRIYDDDDGRTIADMSGVTRRNLIGIRLPESAAEKPAASAAEHADSDRPWENKNALSREDRRSYILGALGASLMIWAVYAVVLGGAILLITKLYA